MATVVDKSGNSLKVDAPLINGSVRVVALTQAQYDGLTFKDPNTLYVIVS